MVIVTSAVCSLELVEDVLGVVERLWLDENVLFLNLVEHGQKILFDLFLDSSLELTFDFLAVLEPLKLLVRLGNHVLLDQMFNVSFKRSVNLGS